MKYLALLIFLFSFTSFADTEKPCCKKKKINENTNTQTINVNVKQEPKVVVKWKTVYKDRIVYKDRVVYRDRIVYKDKIVEKKVEVPVVKEKIVTKTKYKTKVKKYVRTRYPNHNLSLLLGSSRTDLTRDDVGDKIRFKNEAEFDAGLQYSFRVASSFRFGLTGTMNENFYLNLGFDW